MEVELFGFRVSKKNSKLRLNFDLKQALDGSSEN